MKPIIALIDFIMVHEGKKTLRYIEKHGKEEKVNEKTLLKILNDNKKCSIGHTKTIADIY